jgi:NAD(P)-dependent dehydrogenase (short-subunit alcohol dehydrogenase family)
MKRLFAASLVLASLNAPIFTTSAFADTVLITGSDKGIGLGLAQQYAAAGWTVIATARHPDTAKDLKDLAAKNKNVTVEQLDVSSDADIKALAAKYKGKPIDVLLNNAGILGNPQDETLGTFNRKDFHDVMDVNTYGPLAVSEAFRDNVAMSKQKKIIAITSGIGSIGSTWRIGKGPLFYRTSKAALDMAMQSLGVDLKPQGIIVAVITPGSADTDMTKADHAFYGAVKTGPEGQPRPSNRVTTTPDKVAARLLPVIDSIDAEKAKQGIIQDTGDVMTW